MNALIFLRILYLFFLMVFVPAFVTMAFSLFVNMSARQLQLCMPDFSDGRAIEDPCSLDSSGRGMRSLSRLKASADAPADLEKALQKLDAQLKKDDGHE